MIVECDFCGEDVEKQKTNTDGNNFCDMSCYGDWMSNNRTGKDHPNYSKEELVCEFCGNNFKRKKSLAEKSQNNFCTKKCHSEWLNENAVSGEEHHQYNSVEVECSNCSKKKTVIKSKLEEQDNFYCDTKCQVEHQGSPSRWGEGSAKVEKVCKQCKDEYKVYRFRAKDSNFCSKDCVSRWLSENNSGENHVQYTGYKENYGKDWPKERRKAREYYENECQSCGEEFNIDEEHIPVHHIIPVSDFEDRNDAHFQENLVQVCRSCHFKLELSSVEKQFNMLEGSKYEERYGKLSEDFIDGVDEVIEEQKDVLDNLDDG